MFARTVLGVPRHTHVHHFVSTVTRAAVRDTDSATGLFYHEAGPGRFALSLLERTPKNASSMAVIGCISPRDGVQPSVHLRTNPDDVEINPAFWEALHSVLREAAPGDGHLQVEATVRGDGFLHLTDGRSSEVPGRVSSPDDILASVGFSEEKIISSTYEPNNMYRFCNGTEGPMQLPERWLKIVREYIERNE